MNIVTITEVEYLNLLIEHKKNIPIWCGQEALNCYQNKELIKVKKNDNDLAVFLIPIDKNGVRRKYRYFPYLMPIILDEQNNVKLKEIYIIIFNYLFTKYDYVFVPLHPDFKLVASIASQGGLVEMRHTHIVNKKMIFEELNPKLRNHIKNAKKKVELIIDTNYQDYDFSEAIKGSKEEQDERTKLAKKIIDNNNGYVVKVKFENQVIAGLIIVFDNEWAYLLHSYLKKGVVRGAVSYMIFSAIDYAFDVIKVKYFDFEGSVIDEIDDFFSSFNADIVTYPYIIFSKTKDGFEKLINRSINIEGRIKKYERN